MTTELIAANRADLATLAEHINDKHTAAMEAAGHAVGHARRCGELLIEAKSQVAHGEWLPWLESNFKASRRTSSKYMRLASNWGTVASKWESPSHLTIEDAAKLLTGPVKEDDNNGVQDQRDWTRRQELLLAQVEKGRTVVINVDKDLALLDWAKGRGLYERIDRRSDWGNPYRIGSDGSRDDVCDRYEAVYWPSKAGLQSRIADELGPATQDDGRVCGRVLGCHCSPDRCHGDFLARVANGDDEPIDVAECDDGVIDDQIDVGDGDIGGETCTVDALDTTDDYDIDRTSGVELEQLKYAWGTHFVPQLEAATAEVRKQFHAWLKTQIQ